MIEIIQLIQMKASWYFWPLSVYYDLLVHITHKTLHFIDTHKWDFSVTPVNTIKFTIKCNKTCNKNVNSSDITCGSLKLPETTYNKIIGKYLIKTVLKSNFSVNSV